MSTEPCYTLPRVGDRVRITEYYSSGTNELVPEYTGLTGTIDSICDDAVGVTLDNHSHATLIHEDGDRFEVIS